MKELTTQEKIERIGRLIDAVKGDIGRLEFIRESIRKNKYLFNSDRNYLQKLLENTTDLFEENPSILHENNFLPFVEKLMDAGIGDRETNTFVAH